MPPGVREGDAYHICYLADRGGFECSGVGIVRGKSELPNPRDRGRLTEVCHHLQLAGLEIPFAEFPIGVVVPVDASRSNLSGHELHSRFHRGTFILGKPIEPTQLEAVDSTKQAGYNAQSSQVRVSDS